MGVSNASSRGRRANEPIPGLLQALESAGYDDVLVLDAESFRTVLTERREELLEVIADGDELSVGELADRLGRQQSAVSRDLDALFEHAVIDYERDGRRKIPRVRHETVLHAAVL